MILGQTLVPVMAGCGEPCTQLHHILLGTMAPCLLLEAEVLCWHSIQRWAFESEKVPERNTGAVKDLPGRPLPVLGKEARGGGTGRLSCL